MAEHVKSQLSAYIAGGLMETQKRQVDSHLAECERCRQYLSKLRSKEARSKRDALKSAMPQKSAPNLFVNRISRQQAPIVNPSSSARRWILLPLFLGIFIWMGMKRGWFDFIASRPLPPAASLPPRIPASVTPNDKENKPNPEAKPDSIPTTPTAVSNASEASVSEPPLRSRQWKGSFCLIKDHREIILKDYDEWQIVWHEMNGEDSKTPRVDFDRQIVVGIFLGEKPMAGYTVSLLPAKEENGQIIVRYIVTEPPPNQPAAAVIVHPYHLMTIPSTDKKIIFVKGATL